MGTRSNVSDRPNEGPGWTCSAPVSAVATILLVDDEPLFMAACARSLSAWGYAVRQARHGEEALQALRTQSVDVILCDINLPGMSGIELLRAVRSQDRDVPFLLMTGGPELESARLAVEWGAQNYLIKPLALPNLRDILQRTVESYRFIRSQRSLFDSSERIVLETHELRQQFGQAVAQAWMAFQPIVSWSSRSVVAYEALLRSTATNLASPTAMLQVAESLGEVHNLGHMTRGLIAEVMKHHPELPGVFVNLHVLDLLDDQLYADSSPLLPYARRIHFEITERMALEKVPDTRERVARLRQHGYRIAVDDLGEGYSGLNSFAALEPDAVKLDMSLIRDLDRVAAKRKLVQTLVGLCRELGTPLVAEGVERKEEVAALVDLGVDLLQGFYFAHPDYPLPLPRF